MMNVLKNPSFFRPASRPPSPTTATVTVTPSRPDSGVGFERVSRPLNKLSLSGFRRPSSAPGPSPVPLVQDGSYLEMLSLKLSEAVSKALAQPTGPAAVNEQVSGRRPIPAGRGQALGALIASELKAASDNPHLHRAILRSLHRPMSVLLTNLSAHLLPLLSSPAFYTPPAPTLQSPQPNPTQLHASALATFAGELLDTFDDLGLGMDGDIRGDGLKTIREGLTSFVGRTVNPLVGAIKNELMPLIEALETTHSASTKSLTLPKSPTNQHPSIVALQAKVGMYGRALGRYTASAASQSTLATFLISVIWRSLVALSHRPYLPPSPPASPALTHVVAKKLRTSPSGTPPVTPPANRFTMKLPPSRPPSPPTHYAVSTAASDARALYDILSLIPRPAADKETTRLAREAVEEAFDGLKSLAVLLEAVQMSVKPGIAENELADKLSVLTEDLPILIALPHLLGAYGQSAQSIASMLGLSEDEYRKGCLAGFGRAEECGVPVGQRVLDMLHPEAVVVVRWLEMEVNTSR